MLLDEIDPSSIDGSVKLSNCSDLYSCGFPSVIAFVNGSLDSLVIHACSGAFWPGLTTAWKALLANIDIMLSSGFGASGSSRAPSEAE